MGRSAPKSQASAEKSAEKTPPAAPNNRSIAAKNRYARVRKEREEKERAEREANKTKLQQHLLAGAKSSPSDKEPGGNETTPLGPARGPSPAAVAATASPSSAMPIPVTVNLAAAEADGGASTGTLPPLTHPTSPLGPSRGGKEEDTSDQHKAEGGDKQFDGSAGSNGEEPAQNPLNIELPKSPTGSADGKINPTFDEEGDGRIHLPGAVDLTKETPTTSKDDDGDERMNDNDPNNSSTTGKDGSNTAPKQSTNLPGGETPISSPAKKKGRLSKAEKKERKERKKREAEINRKEKRFRDLSPPKNRDNDGGAPAASPSVLRTPKYSTPNASTKDSASTKKTTENRLMSHPQTTCTSTQECM